MSAGQTKTPDIEVTAEGNALRRLLLRSAAIATLPALIAFAWLGLVREPAIETNTVQGIAQAVANAKAAIVSEYTQDLVTRMERLGAELSPESTTSSLDPVASGFPDATAVTVIPLDDLGTVNVEPGLYGIKTHIGVDVVRRAFAGEPPRPESVLREGPAYTLIARPYGDPTAGVVLVQLNQARLNSLTAATDEGRYQLVQRLTGESAQTIAGSLDGAVVKGAAPVAGTAWTVEFSPSVSWLSDIAPHWLALAAALAVTVGGMIIAITLLLVGIPQLLHAEVERILESAEIKAPLKLSVPVLVPLAKMLRQLALLSRRQLVSHARREATREEPEAEATDSAVMPPTRNSDKRAGDSSDDKPPQEQEEDAPVRDDGIPDHIFRDTCIRGDSETELTDELVEKIGRAIAVLAGEQGIQTLVVAHDSRPSSKRIRTTLVKTLLAGGRDIIDLGEVPTPLMHFATHETEANSGIMITGSHSPQAINGMKIIFKHETLTGEGIEHLLETVRAGKSTQGAGRTAKQDIEPDYVDKIAMDVALALPLRIVIDNDFGTAANVAPTLLRALDCEVVSINDPGNGERPEDWSLESALAALGEKVREEGADLGVLFDSDGDRLHTVTETGEAVSGDKLLMLLAKDVLERNPGTDIVYDVKFSRNFAPYITRAGGRALMSRSGQAYVREKMRQANALLAGDFAGHVFVEERWYGFADAMYALARLLEVLAAASGSFGELVAELPGACSTPEIYLPLDDRSRRRIMRTLLAEAEFPGAKVTKLDGLRIDYADGWGLVRNSTTDSALNLRFEGNDETSLERVKNVVRKAIAKAAPDLDVKL